MQCERKKAQMLSISWVQLNILHVWAMLEQDRLF